MPSFASSQRIVKRRSEKLIGIKNSNKAPPMAAIASGNSLLYIFSTGSPGVSAMLRKPGITQRTTATAKQIRVFF